MDRLMPLIIYLDTQDYIKLFNEPDEGPNHQVLAQILAHRDRGEVVIGFSFVTVIEFITKPDAANRAERVRRGQMIKEICGPNAFPPITELGKGATFPNGGRWLLGKNAKVISAREVKERMAMTVREKLARAGGLNRSQRRQLARADSIRELFRRSGSTWGRNRSDFGSIPVSDEIIDSRIFERFMKGQCSDGEFENRMNAWIQDPAEYSRIVYDYADHPNVIEKYFGKTVEGIEGLAQRIQRLVTETQGLNEKRSTARVKLLEAGIEKPLARRPTKQLKIPEPNFEESISKLETVFGKGRVAHFQHYLMRMLKPGYIFKRSDVMDLLQMCYAYECNFFRCDKAMEDNFRDFEPFKGRLVGRFCELPERIANRLSEVN
jgi:hypothetical protein